MNAKIASVGAYVPARRMHNTELAEIVDTSDEWIYSHTGIHYRHLAAADEAASDLAVPAARQAMERAGVTADEVDLVLVATSTPDYVGLPSTACVVQEKLGLPNAGAMDVMAACTGFIYGLETARAYVTAGAARNVLLIGTEVYSKIINWQDRRTCVLFGDGAGAVVVQPAEDTTDGASTTNKPGPSERPETTVATRAPRGATDGGETVEHRTTPVATSLGTSSVHRSHILPALLGSRGAGAESLYRSHGGTRHRYVPGETPDADLKLKMDGRRVYNFAVSTVVETIRSLLERNGMNFDDLRWVVPHQANERIISAAAKRGGWDPEKFYVNIAEYANTSAASIPIALNEMAAKGLLQRGDPILTVGFGSGLTYGGNILFW